MSSYYEQVYAIVREIPVGYVTSYGRIANMLMKPHGARAVGYALRALRGRFGQPALTDIPWHRVVSQKGIIRVPTQGEKTVLQVELLEKESVSVLRKENYFQVDMNAHLWGGLSLLDVEDLLCDLDGSA